MGASNLVSGSGWGVPARLPSFPLQEGLLAKLIFQILAPPIAYHRCLVPIAGSVNGAIMLSQALYWTPRTRDPQGWFYKSQKDWEDETALSRSEQEIARKLLRTKGFWQEKLCGVPATLYFRVDCEILQTRLLEIDIQVCRKPANKIAESSELSQILPENTSEEALPAPAVADFDEKFKNIRKRVDDWNARRWQTDESGKRFLISPSSGQKVYEEALA
jgi:hypothetical protein